MSGIPDEFEYCPKWRIGIDLTREALTCYPADENQRREYEHVAVDHPLHLREQGAQVRLDCRQRDIDYRPVYEFHARPENRRRQHPRLGPLGVLTGLVRLADRRPRRTAICSGESSRIALLFLEEFQQSRGQLARSFLRNPVP